MKTETMAGVAAAGQATAKLHWRAGLLPWLLAALLVMGGACGLAGAQVGGGSGGDSSQEEGGAVAMGPQGRMVRGTVTATAGDGLTVKTERGESYQVVVTTNTRMMKDRQPVKLGDIHAGDGVGAMGVIDAPTRTVHAAALFVVDAAQIKKAREDMGKTYISGKVAAIDDVNLTIQRQDGVSQKILVDESTSFRRGSRRMGMAMRGDVMSMGPGPGEGQSQGRGAQGGAPAESITLADVKVGDTVFGRGALKSGVFVPTELVVIDAAAMGRRRQQGGDAAGAGDSGPAQPPVAGPAQPPAAAPK
jgi:outer membrane lipoprotein SlyB